MSKRVVGKILVHNDESRILCLIKRKAHMPAHLTPFLGSSCVLPSLPPPSGSLLCCCFSQVYYHCLALSDTGWHWVKRKEQKFFNWKTCYQLPMIRVTFLYTLGFCHALVHLSYYIILGLLGKFRAFFYVSNEAHCCHSVTIKYNSNCTLPT